MPNGSPAARALASYDRSQPLILYRWLRAWNLSWLWTGLANAVRAIVSSLPVVALLCMAPSSVKAEPVDLELILAVDTSVSVDAEEYRLQVEGLARAFRHPSVIAAIEAAGDLGIAVAVVQWANPGEQALMVNWMKLSGAKDATRLSQRIAAMPRRFVGRGTAISAALRYCAGLFFTNQYEGRRQVIDLSGDGSDNRGPMPGPIRDLTAAAGITINGLAIHNEEPNLSYYYRWFVIGGTGAFVVDAADYSDFARAIVQKLVREIAGAPLALGPSPIKRGGSVMALKWWSPKLSAQIR